MNLLLFDFTRFFYSFQLKSNIKSIFLVCIEEAYLFLIFLLVTNRKSMSLFSF